MRTQVSQCRGDVSRSCKEVVWPGVEGEEVGPPDEDKEVVNVCAPMEGTECCLHP